jgi:hypothetical protein
MTKFKIGARVRPSASFNYAHVRDIDHLTITPDCIGVVYASYIANTQCYDVLFVEGKALGVTHNELIQVMEV